MSLCGNRIKNSMNDKEKREVIDQLTAERFDKAFAIEVISLMEQRGISMLEAKVMRTNEIRDGLRQQLDSDDSELSESVRGYRLAYMGIELEKRTLRDYSFEELMVYVLTHWRGRSDGGRRPEIVGEHLDKMMKMDESNLSPDDVGVLQDLALVCKQWTKPLGSDFKNELDRRIAIEKGWLKVQ